MKQSEFSQIVKELSNKGIGYLTYFDNYNIPMSTLSRYFKQLMKAGYVGLYDEDYEGTFEILKLVPSDLTTTKLEKQLGYKKSKPSKTQETTPVGWSIGDTFYTKAEDMLYKLIKVKTPGMVGILYASESVHDNFPSKWSIEDVNTNFRSEAWTLADKLPSEDLAEEQDLRNAIEASGLKIGDRGRFEGKTYGYGKPTKLEDLEFGSDFYDSKGYKVTGFSTHFGVPCAEVLHDGDLPNTDEEFYFPLDQFKGETSS